MSPARMRSPISTKTAASGDGPSTSPGARSTATIATSDAGLSIHIPPVITALALPDVSGPAPAVTLPSPSVARILAPTRSATPLQPSQPDDQAAAPVRCRDHRGRYGLGWRGRARAVQSPAANPASDHQPEEPAEPGGPARRGPP